MREKRLRKQQEQAVSAAEPEQVAQKPTSVLSEKKPPAVRPGITVQEQSISHQASSSAPSVVPQRKFPEMQNKDNSVTTSSKKFKSSSSMVLPVSELEVADSSEQHSQEPHKENTQAVTKMSPSNGAELKGTI